MTQLQHEFYSRIDLSDTPEILSLQERLEMRRREVASLTDKLEDLSVWNEDVLKALEASKETVRKERLDLEELKRERSLYQAKVEALRPGARELEEEVQASIEAYKQSEEFEEQHARYFLDGFYYGSDMAKSTYPSWEFDFGGILLPD